MTKKIYDYLLLKYVHIKRYTVLVSVYTLMESYMERVAKKKVQCSKDWVAAQQFGRLWISTAAAVSPCG